MNALDFALPPWMIYPPALGPFGLPFIEAAEVGLPAFTSRRGPVTIDRADKRAVGFAAPPEIGCTGAQFPGDIVR